MPTVPATLLTIVLQPFGNVVITAGGVTITVPAAEWAQAQLGIPVSCTVTTP